MVKNWVERCTDHLKRLSSQVLKDNKGHANAHNDSLLTYTMATQTIMGVAVGIEETHQRFTWQRLELSNYCKISSLESRITYRDYSDRQAYMVRKSKMLTVNLIKFDPDATPNSVH
jgi:hypothetical protein